MNSDGTGSASLVANSSVSYPSWVPVATSAGGSTPPPRPRLEAALRFQPPAPKPKPKPLTCKKGFEKKFVKGTARCVKKHKKNHGHRHKPKP